MLPEPTPTPTAMLIKLINKDCTRSDMLQSAIVRGANVDTIDRFKMFGTLNADEQGEFPLLARAILRQNYVATKLLLDHGANVGQCLSIGKEEKDKISMHDFAIRLHERFENENSKRILWSVYQACKDQKVA